MQLRPNWPLLFFLLPSFAVATTATPTLMTTPPNTCTESLTPDIQSSSPAYALPSIVDGKVSFYAARYSSTGEKQRDIILGNVNQTQPLASAYKTVVLYATLKDVDAGKLKLTQTFTSTKANRSIEDYPAGTNSLLKLAQYAIHRSDNTAADILHLAVTPGRVTTLTQQLSPCTNIYLTSKALWNAQAGLVPEIINPSTPRTMYDSAAAYAALPAGKKVQVAAALNAAAQKRDPETVLSHLDLYYNGKNYHPDIDIFLLNSSTPQAYTDLTANLLRGGVLLPKTQQLFRQIMSTGCCTKPSKPVPFPYKYWGAKAGSGWGLLVMTGYFELNDGSDIAYTYINRESSVKDSDLIEGQIKTVLNWIVSSIEPLSEGK